MADQTQYKRHHEYKSMEKIHSMAITEKYEELIQKQIKPTIEQGS